MAGFVPLQPVGLDDLKDGKHGERVSESEPAEGEMRVTMTTTSTNLRDGCQQMYLLSQKLTQAAAGLSEAAAGRAMVGATAREEGVGGALRDTDTDHHGEREGSLGENLRGWRRV
jgi:hypothetical protein